MEYLVPEGDMEKADVYIQAHLRGNQGRLAVPSFSFQASHRVQLPAGVSLVRSCCHSTQFL